ncbi:10016_t:CDS:2 [Paraglomus brasilianum]|uniref:10016_t:CDS:1 n=1 Tax=Paraglomus brasilianum TaxID=144538 RepID=A0A9N8ZHT2_9GLOM|nr:10016_t:CDS:2 [Paraglomus brasilianum]
MVIFLAHVTYLHPRWQANNTSVSQKHIKAEVRDLRISWILNFNIAGSFSETDTASIKSTREEQKLNMDNGYRI